MFRGRAQLSWITKDTLPIGTYTVQLQSVMAGGASQCLYGWPSGNGKLASYLRVAAADVIQESNSPNLTFAVLSNCTHCMNHAAVYCVCVQLILRTCATRSRLYQSRRTVLSQKNKGHGCIHLKVKGEICQCGTP